MTVSLQDVIGAQLRAPERMLADIAPRPHQAINSTVVVIGAYAAKIGCIAGIAMALVLRLLRIGAQGPGESRGLGRRDQLLRRDTLLDPALQREHRIVLGVERHW